MEKRFLKGYDQPVTSDKCIGSTLLPGRKAVYFHSAEPFNEASYGDRPSINQLRHSDKSHFIRTDIFNLLINYILQYSNLQVDKTRLNNFAKVTLMSPGQFFITCAYKLLIKEVPTLLNGQVKTINFFDPLAGWGDRLLMMIFLAKNYPELSFNYLGNDCNNALEPCYQGIASHFAADLSNFKYQFSARTFEDFFHSLLNSPQQSFHGFLQEEGIDISMTSPPYGTTEFYCKNAPVYKAEQFNQLMTCLINFYSLKLKQSGYLILNMAFNKQLQKQGFSMTRIEEILGARIGFRHLERVCRYAYKSHSGKGMNVSFEPIIVFRMVEDPVPSLTEKSAESIEIVEIEEKGSELAQYSFFSDKLTGQKRQLDCPEEEEEPNKNKLALMQ